MRRRARRSMTLAYRIRLLRNDKKGEIYRLAWLPPHAC